MNSPAYGVLLHSTPTSDVDLHQDLLCLSLRKVSPVERMRHDLLNTIYAETAARLKRQVFTVVSGDNVEVVPNGPARNSVIGLHVVTF